MAQPHTFWGSSSSSIRLFFAGDVMLTRRLPNKYSNELGKMSSFMKKHDYCFGNLETTVHNRGGYPEAFPGGGHAMSAPATLADLKCFGFNVFNTANNHSMDYSHGGLLETLRNLDSYDLPHAGTGKNLADATAPAYLECSAGIVAMIGLTTSYHDSYMAGPQNQDMQGRPGVNPLRYNTIYELKDEEFNALQDIAYKIGINSYHDQARKEGYMQQSEYFKFGTYNFLLSSQNRCITSPNKADLDRNIAAVRDAKRKANVVVVSIHGHQFKDGDKHSTPDFVSEFAKNAIDNGADIVVCHGPHVMRGIEVYNSGLIFHGLGNFILQHESMEWLPEEQYNKLNLSRTDVDGVADFFERRSQNSTKGLFVDEKAWISYVPSITWDGESLKTEIYPIEISQGKAYGLPKLSNDCGILEEVLELSKAYNCSFEIDKDNCKGILKDIKL